MEESVNATGLLSNLIFWGCWVQVWSVGFLGEFFLEWQWRMVMGNVIMIMFCVLCVLVLKC